MIILALLVTGLVNIFVVGKRYVQHSKMRISGGEIGKYFLDPFQSYVREDTWFSNPLGSKTANSETVTIGGKNYKGDYAIDASGLPNNLTRVKVTISWPGAE